mmetsp:Transcript_29860/g.69008  ORF Transcript_29860/g.69008 Transcript_29860/m.69008 type:complete len:456 (+) Transcript_29860:40-1407(+)
MSILPLLLLLLAMSTSAAVTSAAVTTCLQGSDPNDGPTNGTVCPADTRSCTRLDTKQWHGAVYSTYACDNRACSARITYGGKTGCVQTDSANVFCCCESNDCNSKSVTKMRVRKCAASRECLAEGADCYDASSVCGKGLHCPFPSFKCTAYATNCSTSVDCQLGAHCSSGVCKFIQDVGASCKPGSDLCTGTTSLSLQDCPASGTCPGLVADEVCYTRCSHGFKCTDGKCVTQSKPVALGQPCTAKDLCAGASACLSTTGVCTAFGSQAPGVDIGSSPSILCQSLEKDASKCRATDTTNHWKTCPLELGDTTSVEVQDCGFGLQCSCVGTSSATGRCISRSANPERSSCFEKQMAFVECYRSAECANFRDPNDGTYCPACCSQLKNFYDCSGSKKVCAASDCGTYDGIGFREGCNLGGCDVGPDPVAEGSGSGSSLSASIGLFLGLIIACVAIAV